MANQLMVALSAEGTIQQLFDAWQQLCGRRAEAAETCTVMRQRWCEETDPAVKDQLWTQYEAMHPQYEVLSAWTELHYTAWVFSVHGCESIFMPAECEMSKVTLI